MGIDYALVEYGIGQVVYEHLDADICGAGILFLLGAGVLLLPLRLTLAAQYVALADILHYVLYGLFDGAFTYALAAYEYVHEGGLVVYVVPVPELYSVQMCAKCGEHGVGYGGLVKVRYVFGEQLY